MVGFVAAVLLRVLPASVILAGSSNGSVPGLLAGGVVIGACPASSLPVLSVPIVLLGAGNGKRGVVGGNEGVV
jgi:hypothetical protein